MFLHVLQDAVVDLSAAVGELSGIGHHHADLDGVLRARGGGREQRGGKAGNHGTGHGIPPGRLRQLSRVGARTAMAGPRAPLRPLAVIYFWPALNGSLTISSLSNSTLTSLP